jgi:hypothetical protein
LSDPEDANGDNEPTKDLVRVTFHLDPEEWHGSATERLWAEPLGAGRYRLRNSPCYAFDVSAEDVVLAAEEADQLEFSSVLARGGHSTYRLMLGQGKERFEAHWSHLQELGCSYEQGPGSLLSVDVPPTSDIYDVYERLEDGARAEVWDFEEGHCGHPLRDAEP